ncbi:MAG TPA: S8 family serine peptidase [Pyrinomonadaceae bacterium]|jgi:subtilisin family serine protease
MKRQKNRSNNRLLIAFAAGAIILLGLLMTPSARLTRTVTANSSEAESLFVSRGVQSMVAPQDKVAPWVFEHTADGGVAEFLVVLNEQADLSGAEALKTKEEKGRYVYETLLRKAQETQAPMLDWLKKSGIEHRSYYLVNLIWVKGNQEAALALAARPEVSRVEGNPAIRNVAEQPAASERNLAEAPAVVEPGVNFIRAPEVWALGYTGQGIVIGAADTGYRWDHSAIKNQYRGWNGAVADHNYNWHDSVHTGGGSCGPNALAPCDDNGHGTHTAGTAVGDDGAGNQVGVAPGAKWIGCRNMNQGVGTPATYIECFEFFLAPYPVGGTPAQGDPLRAPDVTTNSWSCPPSEGCSANTLQAAVEAQRAAGIVTVVAAGNEGSACSTVADPPGIYDAAYSVGAVSSSTGVIASFSSRGPVTVDGSNRVKPDITAPGVSVRSATRTSTTSYGSLSGTSMATPHVAGAVALLMSAQNTLRDQVTNVEGHLDDTAVRVASTLCGSTGFPNNTYGFGRLDIKSAVDLAKTTLSPLNQNFQAVGGGGSATVDAPTASVPWTATSNASWITNVSPASGTGDATVNFQVAPNTGDRVRRGTITIARKVVQVVQFGSGAPIAVFRPEEGNWYVRNLSGGSLVVQNWGLSTDKLVPGDYDGDGRTDLAVFRGNEGNWYIVQSSTGTPLIVNWGNATDKPAPGDYDGDGKTDQAVFREAEGNWYIKMSTGGSTVRGWGSTGDKPVPGDYDGDGRADIAVFRGTEGNWYIINSSNNTASVRNWGMGGDRPVAADYDGDGKTDIAVYRGAEGNWYIVNSQTNTATIRNWGNSDDRPVPSDYDGDGRADIAVFRSSEGNWYIILSTTGAGTIINFGAGNDVPISSTFVPE